MSKQPIPEFNPKKSFKEVSSVPEFDPTKSFTEKKNSFQNGSGIGTQTSFSGSKPFLPQVPTEVPSVLTEQGKVGYEQEVQKQTQQKQKLSEQLKGAKSAFVSAQGEDVARDIEMYQADPDAFRDIETNTSIGNSIRQGLLTGELANVLPVGREPNIDELQKIADINYKISRIPQSEASKVWEKEGLKIFKDPLLGSTFLAETIGSSLAGLYESGKRTLPASAGIGAAAGAPIGGIGALPGAGVGVMAGISVAGLNLSTSSDIMSSLKDSGVDITDRDALIKAFSNENKMSEIRTNALKYGVPIMAFDVASAGIAGKLIGGAAGKSIAKKIIAGAGEAGIQSVAGSAGELSGQLVSGKKINWNEVALEGIASLATDAPDVAIGYLGRDKSSSNNKNIVSQINKLGVEVGVEDAKLNLDRDLANGVIAPEEYQEGIEFIGKVVSANEKIPIEVEGDNREVSIELVTQKENVLSDIEALEERKAQTDDAYHPIIDNEIKFKQSQVDEINAKIQEEAIKPKITKQLEIPKPQTDAVQVEAAGQVPVLTEATVGEEVEQGEPQPKAEVVTEEGKEEIGGFGVGEDVGTSLRGVKYSDIIVGDKYLEDILSNNKLSEEEKKQVREVFSRGVDYFKFDKEGEQKFQEKFTNPEDITDIADIIEGVSLAKEAEFNFYNTKNYENVKDAVNYIANNPNEYSPKVVKAVKEIKEKLDNPSSSMNRLYAIDVMKELGIKETLKPTEQTPAQQVEQLRAKEQAELKAAIPNADQYLTDGKVDRAKITDAKDLKKFDKIYDKYDKLITPLLPKKETKTEEVKEDIDIDKISSNTGIQAKNLKDLYNINRKIFSQDRIKSLASSIVMDRIIGAMAKRAKVSKDQIYKRIYFKKATPGEIKSLENNSNVLFQANYSDDKTGITFSYDKNTDKFNNLKKEGYITDDKNINDFSGQYIIFHKPDYAFSGDIVKNGKIIVEGQGGIYYPIKFHEDGLVWAASSERAAKAFAKRLNESAQLSPDGKVRLALVSSPNEKVLSSYNAASGIVDVLSSNVFDEKFGLNEEIIKSALIESSNSELGTNITNNKSLKEVVSIIKQKLEPENIGSIDKRRGFIYFGKNNLLAKIAENIKDTKNIEDLVSFFGDGIANKDFVGKRTGKLSRANLVQAFSYMFNEPMLRDVKDSDLTYAVIEVPASKDGGDVVTYEKNESHKSYPYSIVIKDKSAKTTLNILSETSKWNESAIDPLTNKTVAKDRMLNLLDTMSGVSNKPLMISKPKQVDINWEVSKEGKGDPSISSRNPIVEEAAKNLKEGKITNEEYRATVSENSPIGPITRFFAPATENQIRSAISEDKLEKVNIPIEDGIEVALRLDIPAYKNNNTWIVAVHEGTTDTGPPISYTNVGKITNVKFGVKPKGALSIAAGIQKTTIGRMFGKWENIPGDTLEQKGENTKNILGDIVNNPSWVQVGMNPFRHSYFYDRNSDIGRPILKADEVVQIGGLVYAKNPEYGNWTDEAFAVRDSFDSAGNEIRFQDKMGAIITQDSNAIIYALTDPNVSTPLHEMAHAFEHYLTLDERKDVLGWANTNTWTKETSERFARGFEKYLSEGKAPTPALQKIFNKFKEWLTDIYNGIVDSEIDIKLNKKMRDIYASMLGEDKAVTKLNESNVENAIELLDDIRDNKKKAERASSKTKANLEQKITEAETELDKISEEAKIVKVINDNFDKIKKDLKEQGLLNVKC